MKFHALLVVKNEGDIIRQCLESALTWCDAIYAYDTGSEDDTWEVIKEISQKDSRVVLFKKEKVVFNDCLRGYLFSQFRHHAVNGDWFVRLDADEFYYISPRDFISRRLRAHETCVYHQMYEFRYTTSDLDAWEQGKESLADRRLSIKERRRFYIPLRYSEPRMFRYRRNMQWPANSTSPYNAGLIADERIPICHYPHRDPIQLQTRCITRSAIASFTKDVGRHWLVDDWKNLVINSNDSDLRYWGYDAELPDLHLRNHIGGPYKRLLQRIVYPYVLPLLDKLRSGYSERYDSPVIYRKVERRS